MVERNGQERQDSHENKNTPIRARIVPAVDIVGWLNQPSSVDHGGARPVPVTGSPLSAPSLPRIEDASRRSGSNDIRVPLAVETALQKAGISREAFLVGVRKGQIPANIESMRSQFPTFFEELEQVKAGKEQMTEDDIDSSNFESILEAMIDVAEVTPLQPFGTRKGRVERSRFETVNVNQERAELAEALAPIYRRTQLLNMFPEDNRFVIGRLLVDTQLPDPRLVSNRFGLSMKGAELLIGRSYAFYERLNKYLFRDERPIEVDLIRKFSMLTVPIVRELMSAGIEPEEVRRIIQSGDDSVLTKLPYKNIYPSTARRKIREAFADKA